MLYTHRAHIYAQKPTVVGLCWQHLVTIVDVAECCQQLTDDCRLLIILVSSFFHYGEPWPQVSIYTQQNFHLVPEGVDFWLGDVPP